MQIDTKFAREIKDVVTSPPVEDKYGVLKRTLTRRLSASQEQRTRQLLEYEELGDRKPLQFLRHLQGLAENAVPESLLRTLWLGRLPAQMQATRQGDRLGEVAEQADRIHEVNYRAELQPLQLRSRSPSLSRLRCRNQTGCSTSNAGRERHRWAKERFRSRSRSHRRSNEKYCFYHQRFGEKAQKCKGSCTFKKENDQGSRWWRPTTTVPPPPTKPPFPRRPKEQNSLPNRYQIWRQRLSSEACSGRRNMNSLQPMDQLSQRLVISACSQILVYTASFHGDL